MKKYNWESHIEINLSVLRVLGLWPNSPSYIANCYTLYMIVLMTIFLLGHIFSQAINIYFIRTNLEAVTKIISILLVEMIAAFKVYCIIINMKTFKQLLKILKSDTFQPKNPWQIKEIEASVWSWRLISKGFLYMCVGSNAFLALYPLLDKSGEEERRLPSLAWYPYDVSRTPAYEITYIYQVSSIALITTVHGNIDALVAALNVFSGGQSDILCDNLRNLHKDARNISASFRNCVKHHKEILRFTDKLNKFLNWILFGEFFVGAICIGVTMFQLSLVEPMSSEFHSLVIYGIALTVQIFMYCWSGDVVEAKSRRIPYAAFECDWTNFPEDLKKDLAFFTLKSQKSIRLAALDLIYLSIETFMKILKTAWSYFALLRQVNSRE